MSISIKSQLRYPNPFTPVGVEFVLPESGFVTVRILDRAGQAIETVTEQRNYESGKHFMAIDLAKFANDNYFLQIHSEINGELIVETKKI